VKIIFKSLTDYFVSGSIAHLQYTLICNFFLILTFLKIMSVLVLFLEIFYGDFATDLMEGQRFSPERCSGGKGHRVRSI
jgi:hypothetical protein